MQIDLIPRPRRGLGQELDLRLARAEQPPIDAVVKRLLRRSPAALRIHERRANKEQQRQSSHELPVSQMHPGSAIRHRNANYSYRSASVGCRCAARFAGSAPNTSPTRQETPNATAIATGEMGMRMSAKSCTLHGIATPAAIPLK